MNIRQILERKKVLEIYVSGLLMIFGEPSG
jgi:hypothetical protein